MRNYNRLVLAVILASASDCSADGTTTNMAPGAGGAPQEGGPSESDAGAVPTGPPLWPACTQPPCITQINDCAIPLWVHALATQPIDGGNVRKLEPGASIQYAPVPRSGGGRIYAYYKEPAELQQLAHPVSPYNQFVEMTVDTDSQGRWAQNYDISYVDYIALPVSMTAVPRPGQTCEETACAATPEAIVAGCPTEVRNPYNGVGTCMGSYNYCITQDPSVTLDSGKPAQYDLTKQYCSKMAKPPEPTYNIMAPILGSQVYGGYFPENPPWAFWEQVAAWNRGTFPGDANPSDYYKTEPYNDYAGWIHVNLGCNHVYAFSTDDHQNQSGFVRCSSDELRILWCPKG
jgi:hypothetical protein